MALSLPEALSRLPRHPLLYPHASPIHALPTLSTLLARQPPPKVSLYAKREDHASPLACSGNKYRKLEYIVPDILSPTPQHNDPTLDVNSPTTTSISTGPATTLVTEGAIQSNHTIQVASLANALNLSSIILLHKGTGGALASSSDPAAFLRTGNVQIARLLGADIRLLEPGSTSGGKDPVTPVLEEVRAAGGVPYWITSGASLHPLGGVGYARCAFEIVAQEKEVLESRDGGRTGRFEYIFVACGSGSTVGGLVAGFKAVEKMEEAQRRHSGDDDTRVRLRPRKVIGIINSPTKTKAWHEERVLKFARRAAGLVGLDPADITMDDVRLDNRFAATAYGVLDPETKEALELMARKENLILDPVYTAKVARGMMHYVQEGELVRDSDTSEPVNALFVYTGGQSALSAYADID